MNTSSRLQQLAQLSQQYSRKMLPLSILEVGCIFLVGVSLALAANHPLLFGLALSLCALVLVLHFLLEWKKTEALKHTHAIVSLGCDAVTGLPSTFLFEGALAHLAAISNRYQQSFSIIAFDLVSEGARIGLDALDEALLREVAWGVVDCVRLPDTVCRWSKNRFMVLLPETSPQNADKLAQRIGAMCTHICSQKNCAVSIVYGVGMHHVGGDTMTALISAENALEAQWASGMDATKSHLL